MAQKNSAIKHHFNFLHTPLKVAKLAPADGGKDRCSTYRAPGIRRDASLTSKGWQAWRDKK